MKEIRFLNKNGDKWKKFENIIKSDHFVDPDTLADLYTNMTDDLSYARTYFPRSKTVRYLNQLASKIHRTIYRNKREDTKRIRRFWIIELPELLISVRKELLVSLLIFIFSIMIGWGSAANDDTFVRLILGDAYVNMTLQNIEQGDPMAVYKGSRELPMFLGITFNNVRVAFLAFVFGAIFSVGTAYFMFSNGVMLGAFQYLFYERGLFWDSWRTVWIHGTLELSAIVIAGAAGFILGNSILFPKTYKRGTSFIRGAKKGLKIVIGLVPVFITAGLLESFVTRHNDMPVYLNLAIIIFSFLFIIGYFIVYPIVLHKYRERLYGTGLFRGISTKT